MSLVTAVVLILQAKGNYWGGVVIGLGFAWLFGAGAVVAGRWIVKNPSRVIPPRFVKSASNPKVLAFVRVYGTLAIFIGSTFLFSVAKILLPASFAGLVTLTGAVASTFFFYPRTAKGQISR